MRRGSSLISAQTQPRFTLLPSTQPSGQPLLEMLFNGADDVVIVIVAKVVVFIVVVGGAVVVDVVVNRLLLVTCPTARLIRRLARKADDPVAKMMPGEGPTGALLLLCLSLNTKSLNLFTFSPIFSCNQLPSWVKTDHWFCQTWGVTQNMTLSLHRVLPIYYKPHTDIPVMPN